MSFGFQVNAEKWHEDGDDLVRELTEIDLMEVSIVTWPAYPDTTVAVRSRDQWREMQRKGKHPHVLRLALDLQSQIG